MLLDCLVMVAVSLLIGYVLGRIHEARRRQRLAKEIETQRTELVAHSLEPGRHGLRRAIARCENVTAAHGGH